MLHFAGADAEGQRAECTVRGGVAVAADHGHAGLGETELGTDDVDDALAVATAAVAADPEIAAIGFQLRYLAGGDFVHDRQRRIGRGRRVVGGGDREVGAANFQATLAQALEGLRRSDLVDQMEVDIKQSGRAGLLVDSMGVPEFFDDGARHRLTGG